MLLRLLAQQQHLLALRLSQYLRLPKMQAAVVHHWGRCKIQLVATEMGDEELEAALLPKLRACPAASHAELAAEAHRVATNPNPTPSPNPTPNPDLSTPPSVALTLPATLPLTYPSPHIPTPTPNQAHRVGRRGLALRLVMHETHATRQVPPPPCVCCIGELALPWPLARSP